MPELGAEGHQPGTIAVQPQLEPAELEGVGEGDGLVPPQLPGLLHDGGVPVGGDSSGRPFSRVDADVGAQQALLMIIPIIWHSDEVRLLELGDDTVEALYRFVQDLLHLLLIPQHVFFSLG